MQARVRARPFHPSAADMEDRLADFIAPLLRSKDGHMLRGIVPIDRFLLQDALFLVGGFIDNTIFDVDDIFFYHSSDDDSNVFYFIF